MGIEDYNSSEKFLNEVELFSSVKGGQLKRKEDLNIIFEEAFKHNKEKLLEDLSFTAKYLQGLMRVLKKGAQNPEVQYNHLGFQGQIFLQQYPPGDRSQNQCMPVVCLERFLLQK